MRCTAKARWRPSARRCGRSDFTKRPQSLRQVDEQKVNALIEARNAARRTKNFKEADRIRDELKSMGVEIEDTKDGTKWKVKA